MKNKVYSSDHITRALGAFLAILSLIIFVSAFTKMTWGLAFIFEFIFGIAGYWIFLPLLLIYGVCLIFKGQKLKTILSWKFILGVFLLLIGLGFIFGYLCAAYYTANSLNLFDLYGTNTIGLKSEFVKGKGVIDINDGGGIVFALLSSLLNSVSGAITITLIVIILIAAVFFIFYPFIMRFAHFASSKYSMHKIKKQSEEAKRKNEEEERRSLETYVEENKPMEINDDIYNIAQYNQVSPEEIPEEPVVTRSSLYHSETDAEISPVPQETAPVEPISFSNESFDTSLKEAVFNIDDNKPKAFEKEEIEEKTNQAVFNPQPATATFVPSQTTKTPSQVSNMVKEEPAFSSRILQNYDNDEEIKPISSENEENEIKPIEPEEMIAQNSFEETSIRNEEIAPLPEKAQEESSKNEFREEIPEEEAKPTIKESIPSKQTYVQESFIEVPEEKKVEVQETKPIAPQVAEPEDPLKKLPKAKERPAYEFPPIELLRTIQKDPTLEAENIAKCTLRMGRINEQFDAFGIKAKVCSFTVGPSVTRYDIQFQPGVRASSLNGYISDICRSLGGLNARYEEVIMGKTTSGLEIPNEKSTTVSFKELIEAMPNDPKSSMNIPFGVNISGEKVFADLSKFPHMLIAGGTGSGKSVYANSLLATLIMRNRPEDLKLVLIDPKKVEMTKYKDIPHLLCPIITEPTQAKVCLDKLVEEMERRYDIFAISGAKDIRSFNSKCAPKAGLEPMPFIVVFIDEYANLVDSVKTVSEPVAQIAAKARAAGIHLIVATQRPSVNVITGVIKANLDVRVALKVNANQDSQTVIGRGGAEQLNGNGDMLVQCSLISKGGDFIRCQGCYLQDEEIDAIVDFVKGQQKVSYDPYFSDLVDHSQDAKIAEETDKMERAAQREHEKSDRYEMIKADIMTQEYTSISKIQRTYGMGYPMAQRVFARLQAEGIVAQAESQSSSKGAKVLVHDDMMYRDGSESLYGDND